MGKIRFIFGLIGLVLAVSSASEAEMGFLNVEDVPSAIQKVAPSVLQVMVPDGIVVKEFTSADYGTAAFKQELANTKDKHLITQMEFCAINQLDACLIYDDMTVATGFVIFDENHLATNRHVFLNYIKRNMEAYQKRGLSVEAAFTKAMNQPFPIKIAKDLKLVPSGIKQIQYVEWFKNDGLASLANFDHYDFGAFLSSDILVLRATEALGTPLKKAATPALVGENIYILGYPSMTTNRPEAYGKKNSNGWAKLSISSGKRVSIDEGLTRLSKMNSRVQAAHDQIKANPELRQVWENGIILTDADAEYGISGGVIVNEKGEYVGIQSAYLMEYRGTLPGLTITFGCTGIMDLLNTPSVGFTSQETF